mgnify:FL=1
MGSILGTSLSDSQEALLYKIIKYKMKIDQMINDYKAAKDIAIADYKAVGFIDARVKNYTDAWNTMPANYEAKMRATRDRVRKWLAKYAFKMFGARLSDTELNTALSKLGL